MKRTTIEPPVEFAERPHVSSLSGPEVNFANCDPMHRFEPTPHTTDLSVMGRTVRLATNSTNLIGHMGKLFGRCSGISYPSPQFFWRLVVQSDVQSRPPWPWRSTFSDEGIRFAQFGQRNFLAVDIAAREAIGFVSEGLFEDAQGFTSPYIDTLFYMSAAPLGLMPFASACVRSKNQGLLVFGQPNQGKTTASYLATRDGLTIHSDQSVFLEIVGSELRAWGDFVPLAFRPETLQFLPDLRSQTIPFSYCDFSFYYLPKPEPDPAQLPYVTPTCSVVLERGTSSSPRLEPLKGPDLFRCLARHVAFQDDRQFDEQTRKVIAELACLPAYRLAYGSNPADASPFFRHLLTRHAKFNQTGAGTSNDDGSLFDNAS